MKTLTFLEPEIAEKIEEMTTHVKDENPIDRLTRLKNMIDLQLYTIYHEGKYQNFYDKNYEIIKYIIEKQPERLLLHFATYDPQQSSHAAFVTPISDDFDCITTVRKNQSGGPSAVFSYLQRKDSDIAFDLTLVDTHDLNYGDDEEDYIMSYLYGNPYDEDWQHSQKTEFKAIAAAIENNE